MPVVLVRFHSTIAFAAEHEAFRSSCGARMQGGVPALAHSSAAFHARSSAAFASFGCSLDESHQVPPASASAQPTTA